MMWMFGIIPGMVALRPGCGVVKRVLLNPTHGGLGRGNMDMDMDTWRPGKKLR